MSWEKTTQLSARKRKVEAELSFLAAVIPWSCSHRCSHHGKVDLPAPIIYSLALVEKRKGAIRKGATERCLKHLYLFFFFPNAILLTCVLRLIFCTVSSTNNLQVCFFVPSDSTAVSRKPNEVPYLCGFPWSKLSRGSAMIS